MKPNSLVILLLMLFLVEIDNLICLEHILALPVRDQSRPKVFGA